MDTSERGINDPAVRIFPKLVILIERRSTGKKNRVFLAP